MTQPGPIVYYITAHGYGHGVRSCDVINAVRRQRPDAVFRIVTDLPADFLSSRIDLPAGTLRPASFDVGMVQLDSIRVDVGRTLEKVQALVRGWEHRVEQEAAYLAGVDAALVVADIPAIPLAAAKRIGRPALAAGNFAWDWIYEEFTGSDPAWAEVVERFRSAYALADLLLKLPFSEPMAAFPVKRDVPLVSRPGVSRREEIAAHYGIDPAAEWVLLSFSTLELSDAALDRMQDARGRCFLTMLPLEWKRPGFVAVDRHRFAFADVIASVDTVVSKPGYGILSECVVNDRPLVFAERTDFREYPVLEEAVKRHLRHQHIPAAELYAGNLVPYLDRVRQAPPPLEPLAADGGEEAARTILSFLDG